MCRRRKTGCDGVLRAGVPVGQSVDKSTAAVLPLPGCRGEMGEGVSDLSESEGLAQRLGVTLSAPATSHLYCNANPWPVPDGAFPASWVHSNMIIYPEHFSSL